jgi:hypothetical protein
VRSEKLLTEVAWPTSDAVVSLEINSQYIQLTKDTNKRPTKKGDLEKYKSLHKKERIKKSVVLIRICEAN